jgi:hypothetical protein
VFASFWGAAPVVTEFSLEHLHAKVDAVVAHRAGRAHGDDPADVTGGLAAERTASEFTAQLALSDIVAELPGDFVSGFADLVVCGGSDVEVGFGVVERGSELVEGRRSRLCQATMGRRGQSRRSSQGGRQSGLTR